MATRMKLALPIRGPLAVGLVLLCGSVIALCDSPKKSVASAPLGECMAAAYAPHTVVFWGVTKEPDDSAAVRLFCATGGKLVSMFVPPHEVFFDYTNKAAANPDPDASVAVSTKSFCFDDVCHRSYYAFAGSVRADSLEGTLSLVDAETQQAGQKQAIHAIPLSKVPALHFSRTRISEESGDLIGDEVVIQNLKDGSRVGYYLDYSGQRILAPAPLEDIEHRGSDWKFVVRGEGGEAVPRRMRVEKSGQTAYFPQEWEPTRRVRLRRVPGLIVLPVQ